MSLRDLATSSCAGSSNPLSALSDALLPSRPRPHHYAGASSSSSFTASQEHNLLHGDVSERQLESQAGPSSSIARPMPRAPMVDAFLQQQALPPPLPGGATHRFERAFSRVAQPKHAPQPPPQLQLQHPMQQMRRFSYTPISRMHFARAYARPSFLDSFAAMNLQQAPQPQQQQQQKEQQAQQSGKNESEQLQPGEYVDWSDQFTAFDSVLDDHLPPPDVFSHFLYSVDPQQAFNQWLQREDEAETYTYQHARNTAQTAEQALEAGIRHRQEGRLKAAIQFFERALNRDSDKLNDTLQAKAWYLLGITLADTDDDVRAIRALRSGLSIWGGEEVGRRKVDNPFVRPTLMALSVSYTNELDIGKALLHIREWLNLWQSRHTAHNEPVSSDGGMENAEELQESLVKACRAQPGDADVLTMLAILHNVNREYGLAAGAFQHAVSLRPGDASLWNKLGATLANGGDSDNALRAYRKAVDLSPKLVRAWVNVGTAYANRCEYEKAIQYYLRAIRMSEVEDGVKSGVDLSGVDLGVEVGVDGDGEGLNVRDGMGHVWGYLRTALISAGRAEMVEAVERRDLSAFKGTFSF